MRPEDEALLARVPARRREAVKAALEELQQIRQEWAGTTDEKLPSEVRERGLAAALVVRRATQSPVSVGTLAVGLLLTAISIGLAIFQPVTFYTFSTAGEGNVRCLVRERALGLVPVRSEEVRGIVSATGERWRESRRETDSNGHQRSVSTTVQTLTLKDATGRSLHERRMEYILGASLPDVAQRVESIALGRQPAHFVRWATVWPAHLAATLFGLVGFAMLWSVLADALSWLSFSLRWLNGRFLTNGLHALVFAALLAAWGIAAVGGNPPDWLVTTLRLGP